MGLAIGLGLGLPFGGAVSLTAAQLLLANETQGLAIDFTDMSMSVKDTGTPANNFSGNPNDKFTYTSPTAKVIWTPSGFQSGTTLRTEYTTAGTPIGLRVEPARTNLFLNSRAAATQSITVTAVAHTLSFVGTGTITLSGVSVDGPLVGTGANDLVQLTFTPTAGLLTCTVSGSIDYVQLEVGSYASSRITTTGASATRAVDNITLATSLFPISLTNGILVVKSLHAGATVGGNAGIGLQATTNDRVQLRLTYTQISSAGVSVAAIVPAGIVTNTVAARRAVSYAANDFASCYNGGSVGTDVAGAAPTALTNLALYTDSTAGVFEGWIQQILYLPRNRASNAELQGFLA